MTLTAKQSHRQPGSATNLGDLLLESALRKTGKPIETWFQALDNFNSSNYEHNILVNHLIEAYNIGQWEADAIVRCYQTGKGHKTEHKPHNNQHHDKRNRRRRPQEKRESKE